MTRLAGRAVLLATLAAVLLGLAPAAGLVPPALGPAAVPPAVAATSDLVIVSSARYDVLPAERRVAVGVDLAVGNRRAETATRRFYFDRAYLVVPAAATAIRATGELRPRATVARRTATYLLVRLDFARLYGGRTANMRVTFDLADPGGAPDRDVRVGATLVSFPVWAFGTEATPGSSVAVAFPPGYDVRFEPGDLPVAATEADGRRVWRTEAIPDPLAFFAYAVGEQPGAYAETPLAVPLGTTEANLLLRAWVDDPDWATRTGDLLARGLPVLAEDLALPWPRTDRLIVEEAVSRSTGGYAGLFDPSAGRVEIAYWADAMVVLHEAAHAWLNGTLVGDRWTSEGFASLYAERAAAVLGVTGRIPELSEEISAAQIPLNDWGPTGTAPEATETYGYAASLVLARAVLERATPETMRLVWADAAARRAAYQPPAVTRGEVEPEAGVVPDWRGLLDLLEDRTGRPFDDLWRSWVVREADIPLLDARSAARASHARTVGLARDWALPLSIRAALRAWQFPEAERLMVEARAILGQRAALESAAARAGLTLAPTVRDLFEAGSLADASATADATARTITAIVTAEEARPASVDPLLAVGLLFGDPEGDLADAEAALAAGDLDTAVASAERAWVAWTDGDAEGRRRLLFGAALLATVGVLGSAIRNRRRAVLATLGAGWSPASPTPVRIPVAPAPLGAGPVAAPAAAVPAPPDAATPAEPAALPDAAAPSPGTPAAPGAPAAPAVPPATPEGWSSDTWSWGGTDDATRRRAARVRDVVPPAPPAPSRPPARPEEPEPGAS